MNLDNVKVNFTARAVIYVGLWRMSALTAIREYCFIHGLNCEIQRLGGFFIQEMALKIEGVATKTRADQYKRELESLLDEPR